MLSLKRIVTALLILAAGCTAAIESEQPWSVAVTTTGGITGSGVGAYSIDSDGRVEVTKMSGSRCVLTATAADLERVRQFVMAARPSRWRDSYAPEDRCCDRIEYTLTLDLGGRIRGVEWIDDPLPMPSDLTALAETLTGGGESVRAKYGDRCE